MGDPERLRLQVIGVAADAKHYGRDQPDQQTVHVPMSALPFSIPLVHMAVRVRGTAPQRFARTLREAVWRASPDLPVPRVRPMTEWVSVSMSQRRFDSYIFGSLGVLALLLAAAGLYGTLLYGVRQRRRELGIRMALGAGRPRVEREVVARRLRLAVIGSVAGVLGSIWVVGLLEGRLFEIEGSDPVTLAAAAATLIVAAGVASWILARRAGRTDPLEAFSSE